MHVICNEEGTSDNTRFMLRAFALGWKKIGSEEVTHQHIPFPKIRAI